MFVFIFFYFIIGIRVILELLDDDELCGCGFLIIFFNCIVLIIIGFYFYDLVVWSFWIYRFYCFEVNEELWCVYINVVFLKGYGISIIIIFEIVGIILNIFEYFFD